jgi:hypothetical protein
MRRHWILGLLLLLMVQMGRAEGLKMREVFKQMPDSLLPYLSENNRLDFIDFIDSKMKAEVKNRLGGTSEMTVLTDSTLSIRMSEALQIDMLLLRTVETADAGSSEIICLIETFGADSLSLESTVRFFTSSWQLLNEPPSISVSDQNTISSKKVQTILKRDDKILKKN